MGRRQTPKESCPTQNEAKSEAAVPRVLSLCPRRACRKYQISFRRPEMPCRHMWLNYVTCRAGWCRRENVARVKMQKKKSHCKKTRSCREKDLCTSRYTT